MYLADSELEEDTKLKILIIAILQRSAAEPACTHTHTPVAKVKQIDESTTMQVARKTEEADLKIK